MWLSLFPDLNSSMILRNNSDCVKNLWEIPPQSSSISRTLVTPTWLHKSNPAPLLLLRLYSLSLFFKIYFWQYCVACGIFVPWPGIEPTSLVLEALSLSHWTAREVFRFYDLLNILPLLNLSTLWFQNNTQSPISSRIFFPFCLFSDLVKSLLSSFISWLFCLSVDASLGLLIILICLRP